jgi:hypothetical protein
MGATVNCHSIVPCNMSSKDACLLGVNTMDGSWSVEKDEGSCMEVDSDLLYGIPRYHNVLGV